MKRLFYSLIIGALVSTLAFGAEVRKLGEYDLSWGPYGTTWTSPAGKVVRYLPRYFDNNAFADNLALYGKSVTGDGSGSITGFNIPLYISQYLSVLDAITPWVDVRAHGAVGNGTTDDGPSILLALNAIKAAGGGTLFVPFGRFRINTQITIDEMPQFIVRGVGGMHTPIGSDNDAMLVSCFVNGTGGGTMFKINGTVTAGHVVTAHNLWTGVAFDNRLNANNIAFELTEGYDRAIWERCAFFGGLYAFTFSGTGTFDAWWEKCFFFGITKAFNFPVNSGSMDPLHMTWVGNIFRECGYAVYALYGNSFYFRDNIVEACTSDGYYLTGVYFIHIDGDHFEQNQRDVYVDTYNAISTKILTIKGATHSKNVAGGQTVAVLVNYAAKMIFTGNYVGGVDNNVDYKVETPGGPTVEFVQNDFTNGYSVSEATDLSRSNGTWTPSFTGLTVDNGTGGVTYSGEWWKNGPVIHWTALITVTGTATTASDNAANTYITNAPFNINQLQWQSATVVDQGTLGGGAGGIIGQAWVRGSGINVIHMPGWTARNINITISGTSIVQY